MQLGRNVAIIILFFANKSFKRRGEANFFFAALISHSRKGNYDPKKFYFAYVSCSLSQIRSGHPLSLFFLIDSRLSLFLFSPYLIIFQFFQFLINSLFQDLIPCEVINPNFHSLFSSFTAFSVRENFASSLATINFLAHIFFMNN